MKRKAEALLNSIHSLQRRLYDFSSELDDKGKDELSQLATESGFELDISYMKMEELISKINSKSINFKK